MWMSCNLCCCTYCYQLLLVENISNGQVISILNSKSIVINIDSGDFTINDNSMVETKNVMTSNGAIHAIDLVLVPLSIYCVFIGYGYRLWINDDLYVLVRFSFSFSLSYVLFLLFIILFHINRYQHSIILGNLYINQYTSWFPWHTFYGNQCSINWSNLRF